MYAALLIALSATLAPPARAAEPDIIWPGSAAPPPDLIHPPADAWRAAATRLPLPDAVRLRRIDMSFQDAPLQTVFWFLASVGEVNIVLDEAVKGSVTVQLRDVTWEEAFFALLAAKGLAWQGSGRVLTVSPIGG